jgi:hypothetical protein
MACPYCGMSGNKHLIGCPNDDDERPRPEDAEDMMTAAKKIIEEQAFNWNEWHRWFNK